MLMCTYGASPGIFDTNTYFAASFGFVSYICAITSEFRIIWGLYDCF